MSNFIENLKLTLYLADPSTEPIMNLINTKYQDFEIPNPNEDITVQLEQNYASYIPYLKLTYMTLSRMFLNV